ncbi:hypothetical protein D3C85_324330 [compost metagenome]
MGLAEHRRLDELAIARGNTAAEQTAALTQGIVDMLGDLAHRRRIDQRAGGHALLQAVADLELADLFHQALGEALVDALLHQDAIGADAGLPGVAELALHDPGHRLFQVGVVEHDKGRIAAQLEAEALDLIGALAHQQAAHSGRACEGNLAHRWVAGQLFADPHRHAGDHVEHPGRNADPLGQHRQRQRRQRRQVRGFDDHRAASRQGRRALAGDHRVGEVPRGDGGADPDRLFQGQQAAVTAGRRNGLAVNPPGLLGEPFDEAGAVADFTLGFMQRLALLAGHDQRQIVEVIEHGLIPTLQQHGTFCRRTRTPGRPGALCGFDGAAGFAALQSRHPRQAFAVGRVDDIHSGCVIGSDPLPVDVSEFCQQAGVFQTILEHDRVLFRDSLQFIQRLQTRMLKALAQQRWIAEYRSVTAGSTGCAGCVVGVRPREGWPVFRFSLDWP